MSDLWDGFVEALHLLFSLDPDVVNIAWRSLRLAVASTIIAALICLPLGTLIHFYSFRGKSLLTSIIQTLYSFPTVAVGLIVFLFISRAGPLGSLGLLFTPEGIVLGQIVLISPVMLGLTISALSGVDKSIKETALSLGASDRQAMITVLKEARFAVVAALVMGFGRAFSEVGVSMMVGGNIYRYTRTLTTGITLEASMGNTSTAIALGIILMGIALGVNIIFYRIQHR